MAHTGSSIQMPVDDTPSEVGATVGKWLATFMLLSLVAAASYTLGHATRTTYSSKLRPSHERVSVNPELQISEAEIASLPFGRVTSSKAARQKPSSKTAKTPDGSQGAQAAHPGRREGTLTPASEGVLQPASRP